MGQVTLELVEVGFRRCMRVQFFDSGPGIPDVELAIRDGFTTVSGMGLVLGGAKRLVNEFKIESALGKGTRVTIVRWR